MIEQKPLEDTPKPPEKGRRKPPAPRPPESKVTARADGLRCRKNRAMATHWRKWKRGEVEADAFDAYAAQARTNHHQPRCDKIQRPRSATINRQTLRLLAGTARGASRRAKLDFVHRRCGPSMWRSSRRWSVCRAPPPQAGMPMPRRDQI